jgi:hypothetical protein
MTGTVQQQIDAATSQVTPVGGTLARAAVHANGAKAPKATRKRLKRIDRALRRIIRTLQKGLRKRTVEPDVGFRLLDLARAAQAATRAALGGGPAVAPNGGLAVPRPLSASRALRPRPPLP